MSNSLKYFLGGGAALLAVCALLVRAQTPVAGQFVGAAACGECHRSAYQTWSATAHAKANERLPRDNRNDSRCLRCHGSADGSTGGVQCETCHGAGVVYAKRHVMKDKELAHLVGLVKVSLEDCRRCHTATSPALRPFAPETAWLQIRHGLEEKRAGPQAEADN